jgi:L-threonylcarbamoyladenylate synthase
MRISLQESQRLLESGQVVSLPTETVYGLGALLKFPQAIDKVFSLKGRPNNNPLIIHLANSQLISSYAKNLPEKFKELTQAFWPGPMTLIIEIEQELIPIQARAGLPTAAFRVPNHPLTLQLLSNCGPLVMPSANLSGKPSATSPSHVENDFGLDFPVLDGGNCQSGLESTILMHQAGQWKIIRLGILEPEIFSHIIGYCPPIVRADKDLQPLCPGQLYRHYAPKAKLTLAKDFPPHTNEFVIGFGDASYPPSYKLLSLGFKIEPLRVAENLYRLLRQLDERGIEHAFVDMRFPDEGLWKTIAERLSKAANS